MNILIIDNCESLRLFCTITLSRQGHEVFTADTNNYNEVLSEHIYDLDVILINVNPAYPGIAQEVYAMKEELNPTISIIIMSSYFNCPTISNLIDKGCIALPLPFTAENLLELIQMIYIIRLGGVNGICQLDSRLFKSAK